MITDPFAPLRKEYLEGAWERVSRLPAHLALIGDDPTALREIRLLAHNLRGSGGFYGFAAITSAATELEELALASISGETVSYEAISALAERLIAAVQASATST